MAELGEAIKSDSTAMKTGSGSDGVFAGCLHISMLQLLWLVFAALSNPQAIFNMSFFNFSPSSDSHPDEWRVSRTMWIYWIIAIPSTGLTLFAWLLWKRNTGQSLQIDKLWRQRVSRQRLKQDQKA
ncbi:hypothetical protein K469DRAFT_707178 [Zopfia rhizophila CBS 207.26]|uniref:Uncharacterized protein n=1 Tax=Zopfia rhizophila CBS 207.26 TaxID=1314779 RepID=A0A6A6E824_9PEZI|nr:hypothetical protein K469DRAFT_707178 [Zopfia rhizophila CBS 207.26]